MSEFTAKRLVIDANVAIAASGEGKPENASRIFLETVLAENYIAVMTKKLLDEWRREGKEQKPSVFSMTWLSKMATDGDVGRICFLQDLTAHENVWLQISELYDVSQGQLAMSEDFHLISASLETDKIVISLEKKVRVLFKKAAQEVKELQDITWVNPDKPEEMPIEWLRSGANPEPERLLGFSRKL